MLSQGRFHTDCVIRGEKHGLVFEIVETLQEPLLTGATCERLGLMAFTIPEELHKVEANQCAPLTKEQLLTNYTNVFMDTQLGQSQVKYTLNSIQMYLLYNVLLVMFR